MMNDQNDHIVNEYLESKISVPREQAEGIISDI